MEFNEYVRRNKEKQSNCKESAGIYGIFNDRGQFIEHRSRPNICGVPYCRRCETERQKRLQGRYKPYFDAYEDEHIRHVICTTPAFSRDEFAQNVELLLNKVRRFHEKVRKSLKYPFRSILNIEPHYQEDTDTYNFHVHYGVFSMLNIKTIRDFWCDVFGPGLTVKFPQYKGKVKYKVRKYAFLEYITRRRVEQARRMPLEDYFLYLRKRNLIKRIGFNKEYLAVVTTLRNKNELPDGYVEVFLGSVMKTDELPVILLLFKELYKVEYDENCDIKTVKTIAYQAFQRSYERYERQESEKESTKVVQTTL